MADQPSTGRPIQFSIRLLIFATALIAILATFHVEAMNLAVNWFYTTLIATFVLTLIVARSFSIRRIIVPCIFGVPFAIALTCACFARYRLIVGVFDTNWPRRFPYPDTILDQMIDSRAASHSDMPPNSIDIDAGYTETFYAVIVVAVVAAAVLGWTIGMATRSRNVQITTR